MDIKLVRRAYRDAYTIGSLYFDGEYQCDTVEDKDRGLKKSDSLSKIAKTKVYGKTAIPKGTYRVILSWSRAFKQIMPEILDVPGFSGIRIHSGNSADDSLGCVIVGENKVVGKVINSRATYQRILAKLKHAEECGEDFTITIQ